jgi:DNA-binding NtrC family response regulator
MLFEAAHTDIRVTQVSEETASEELTAAPAEVDPLAGRLDTNRPFKDVKREIIDAFEKVYVRHLLDRHGGNLSAAERSSGLSRRHLRSLMRKHGLYEWVVRSRIASLLEELP